MTNEDRIQNHRNAIEVLRSEITEIEAVIQRNQDAAVAAGQADEVVGLMGDYGIIAEALHALRNDKADTIRRHEAELNRLADIAAGLNPDRDLMDELLHPEQHPAG